MDAYWSDQIALITGSSRGLGLAYAEHLAALGCRVIVHGRSVASAQAGLARLGEGRDRAQAVGFDVADADAVRDAMATVRREVGDPTILINNAGNQSRAPFQDIRGEDWDAVIDCHLSGAFRVSREVVGAMIERRAGKIVHIGSVTSQLARQTVTPYSTAKGGLLMLTRGMTADLARYGICVNLLSPGYFRTDMNEALMADPQFCAWLEQRTPAGRWGEVPELLGALEFLCGPHSSFVTGQNLTVDGGMTAVL